MKFKNTCSPNRSILVVLLDRIASVRIEVFKLDKENIMEECCF